MPRLQALVILCTSVSASALAQPSISAISPLPEDQFTALEPGSRISDTGATVSGSSRRPHPDPNFLPLSRPIVWTRGGGSVPLPLLLGHESGAATGVSYDGGYIIGTSTSAALFGLQRPVRWTFAGSIQDLGIPAQGAYAIPQGLSRDGSVVVGLWDGLQGAGRAFVWRDGIGTSDMGAWRAQCTNQTGTAIAGDDGGLLLWTQADGLRSLGRPVWPPFSRFAYPFAVTDDGTKVVGEAAETFPGTTGSLPFVWTSATGLFTPLDILPGSFVGAAWGATPDASLIVGWSGAQNDRIAVIWDEGHLVRMSSVLLSAGIDLTGWNLQEVTSVSSNASAFAGNGVFNGQGRAWVATVPSCRVDFDGNGSLQPSDVAAMVNTWFTGLAQGTLTGDWDRNGLLEPADVAAFVRDWFATLSGGC